MSRQRLNNTAAMRLSTMSAHRWTLIMVALSTAGERVMPSRADFFSEDYDHFDRHRRPSQDFQSDSWKYNERRRPYRPTQHLDWRPSYGDYDDRGHYGAVPQGPDLMAHGLAQQPDEMDLIPPAAVPPEQSTTSRPVQQPISTEPPRLTTSQTPKNNSRPPLAPSTPSNTNTSTPAGPSPRPPTMLLLPTSAPSNLPPATGNSLNDLMQLFGSPYQLNIIRKPSIDPNNATKTRSKGFLSLFEVIKFANSRCSISVGMEGVCYHDFECHSLGGVSTEPCGDGLGVCCIFVQGCGDSTQQPLVYFESPNYPNPVRETMICALIVILRPKVQQLRLDFIMFELSRPTDGDCMDDQFVVSGQNSNFVIPALCGINTGQHIYVDVDAAVEHKVYLSFFAKVATGSRAFNIKVSQLESNLAPDGCLQYYTEPEGVVQSFNYESQGTVVDNPEATYLNNLNYAICLMRGKDICSVVYYTESVNGDQLDFQIINKDEAENDLTPDGQAGVGIFSCPDDYIAVNYERLCGERFNDGSFEGDLTANGPVRQTAAGPIVLPVRSDGAYVGRGFRLLYKQESCS